MLCFVFTQYKANTSTSARKGNFFVLALVFMLASRPFFLRRQCGRVVRALALRSGDPGFKTRSDHSPNLFPSSPWFNFLAALVNSQLVCLRPVEILNSCSC